MAKTNTMVNWIIQHKYILIICLLALILRFSTMFFVYHGDVYNHIYWGKYAIHYGLNGIYDRPFNLPTAYEVNQPPGSVLIFAAMRFVFEQGDRLVWFLNNHVGIFPSRFAWFYDDQFYPALLKLPAVLADVGIGIVLYLFTKRYANDKIGLFVAAIYLFNPITFYNSAIWGQTDATVNFFGLLSFYLLLKHRPTWAIFALATCLFIKASLLIFIPIFLIVLYKQKVSFKKVVGSTIAAGMVIYLVTLPFHNSLNPLWFLQIYKDKVVFGTINAATENAFNFWALIFGLSQKVPAKRHLFGLTIVAWGYILFAITAIFGLIRLWKKPTIDSLVKTVILAGFSSFIFFAGMHERYLFPIFPYFALLVGFYRKYLWLYIVTAFIHLTNLYYLWWAPTVPFIKNFLLKPNVIPVFVVGMLLCFGIYIFMAFIFDRDSPLQSIVG